MSAPVMRFTYPLSAGDVVSTSFRILRSRPALLLCLPLIGPLLGLLVSGGLLLALWRPSLNLIEQGRDTGVIHLSAAYIATWVGLVLVSFLVAIVGAKVTAMQIAASAQIARTGQATLASAWAGSKGYLRRWIPLMLALWIVGLLAYGLMVGLLMVPIITMNSEAGMAGFFLLGLVLMLALAVIALWLGTRLALLTPVLALEPGTIGQGLRRAWQLTKGAFGRTLGYYLLGSLIAGGLSMVASTVMQLMVMTNAPTFIDAANPSDVLATLVPTLVVYTILQTLAVIVSAAYLPVHLTVMYLDAANREQLPAAAFGPRWVQPGGPMPGFRPGQYPTGQYPTGQYPTAQYPTAQYPTAQNSTAQNPTAQHPPAQHRTSQNLTNQYSPTQQSAAQPPSAPYPSGQYPASPYSASSNSTAQNPSGQPQSPGYPSSEPWGQAGSQPGSAEPQLNTEHQSQQDPPSPWADPNR